MTKRLVLQQTNGARAGLRHLLGTTDDLPAGATLPSFLPAVRFSDHEGPCSLVTVTPRYVLYREIREPAGQLRSFHPEQQ